jgi:hypothetical protein
MGRKLEGKIDSVKVSLPHVLYERFKLKALTEGYSMQKAASLLIEHYTNDTLIIKDK